MPEKNRQASAGAEGDWRLKDIEKLIDLLVEREISEFELEKDGFRIRIRRGESHGPVQVAAAPEVLPVPVPTMVQAAPPMASPMADPAPPPAPDVREESAEPAGESTEGLYIIKS